jgi:hypothetical protein
VSWKRPFDDLIPLPGGRQLVTLEDAGSYITMLPKAEQQLDEWQTAVEALLLVVKHNGPTMMARIGVMRGSKPLRRAGVRPGAQGQALGTPQAGARPVTTRASGRVSDPTATHATAQVGIIDPRDSHRRIAATDKAARLA